MRELYFRVKFLSDIIFQASSNTEGKVVQLDFIPGSIFLGIVAQKYSEFLNPFDIFHSGKVRFGDAHILCGGKATYKIPLSYFQEKLDALKIINRHLATSDKQLKQIREGFITKDGEVIYIEYDYSQKSAYDREKRRSKDSQMYGYKAMRSGLCWSFCIRIDDSIALEDEQKIADSLVGIKRAGKSKSAQYGLIEISKGGSFENIENMSLGEEVTIYANSRIALFDANGAPVCIPTIENLGLTSGKILWDKCQIRTTSFAPYNSKRAVRDYERAVIDKGSVMVVGGLNSDDAARLKRGVGGYLSEGFGDVLINPTLTQKPTPVFAVRQETRIKLANTPVATHIGRFLQKRRETKTDMLDISQSVREFIEKHKDKFAKVSKSQWGQIRAICQNANDENIAQKIDDFISKGVSKTKWDDGKKLLLENANQNITFVRLLSMQMPKLKFENSNGGKK